MENSPSSSGASSAVNEDELEERGTEVSLELEVACKRQRSEFDMASDQGCLDSVDICPDCLKLVDWKQDDQSVSIKFKLVSGRGQPDIAKVDVTFSDELMTIKLPDGCLQYWHFHCPIKKDDSCVSFRGKKNLLKIKVIKKDAGSWPYPIAVQESGVGGTPTVPAENSARGDSPETEALNTAQEVRTKEGEPLMELPFNLVKSNFFETNDTITVQIYVKNVSKDAVKTHYEKQAFTLKFQTSDSQFLQQPGREGASEETVFCMQVNTRHPIVPSTCKHRSTASSIELTLKKATLGLWKSVEPKKAETSGLSQKSSTWMPAGKNTALPSAAKAGGASGGVVFDEMAGVTATSPDSLFVEGTPRSTSGWNDSKSQKPTAKVPPLSKGEGVAAVQPGFTGLDNLGNTCFMNSILQVLANTRELRDFFTSNSEFQQQINRDNVLGSGGQLAVCFGVLLRRLWSGDRLSYRPDKLKTLVSKQASQFSGFAQHDAQEFLIYLLDGLHEDLNRVVDKPYTATVESEGRPDHIVADEAWEAFKKRNDSFVTDLLFGQYKSKVVCPVCNKVSITFDAFSCLTVPLPKQKQFVTVTFMWRDPRRTPVKYCVHLVKDSSVRHLKEILCRKTAVQPRNMRVFEVNRSLFFKHFDNNNDLNRVAPSDIIIVSEVLSQEEAGEEVVELQVIQRTLTPHQYPTRCSACHKESKNGDKLRRCAKCLKVGYCDQSCQRTHWPCHRNQCSLAPEPVGCPFLISLPKSHCSYSRIATLMESFSRYSVNTFQPPVKTETPTAPAPATSVCPPPPPPPPSIVTPAPTTPTNAGDQQLPWQALASNLSSSSGSQSSGSLSSLDSISSCSSTATLTAETPHPHAATFQISPDDDDDKDRDESKELEEQGSGDTDSGVGSSLAASCTFGQSGAEGDTSYEISCDREKLPATNTDKSAGSNIQSVAASVSLDRSVPLFFIKPVTTEGQGIQRLPRLDDKGEEALDMSEYKCVSMDWRNNDKQPSYVMVQSKPLEAELDESMKKRQEVTDNITLQQCLELFTEPEMLTANDAWYCNRCKEHREAEKQMSVWKLPHTLVIQLKRFSFHTSYFRHKIDKRVDFPIKGLDMSRFALGVDHSDAPPLYDLYGVVNHVGSLLGGHYTAFARCADLHNPHKNEVGWRYFDDNRVSPVSNVDTVVNSQAYLLFYRLRAPFLPSPSPPLPLTSSHAVQGAASNAYLRPLVTLDSVDDDEEDGTAVEIEGYSNPFGPAVHDSNRCSPREKCDSEKEEDETDGGGMLIAMDTSPSGLDYTDINAVD